MTRALGRSLELYYIDGRPDGMLTAELFNWTGHVLMAPRTQIATALARPEASYAGIYLLLGELDGAPLAYIGEGEDISARIRSHDVKKDWWSSAVLVTATANKLNKAHVRYLEARLIAEAKSIGRTPLENGTAPNPPSLSEADVAKMEAFLENLFVVLPAVRVDMFIQRARSSDHKASAPKESKQPRQPLPGPETASGDVRFRLELPRKNFSADAVLNERGEFVVLAGSNARPAQNLGSYTGLYNELVRAGVIAPDTAGQLRFASSYVFNSPSAAASVASGTSANGAVGWKHVETGMTYKDWEAQRLGNGDGFAESPFGN
ncbi:GIY-YIG nuclease family protein [Novosphingobium aerophilum]|uniref:GIY-YIG nuclease family protein n=1 Tax=Novosphingobium aerophilum TaxID=2839843 RepID=A0A7X1FAR5_9SPHN|nr:GIY-YIG nuclease family protein [Novosphingobium aerophilum]MBC2653289.1 GIY-YIG nuclease family protein [Novosphingobium aerophilum]